MYGFNNHNILFTGSLVLYMCGYVFWNADCAPPHMIKIDLLPLPTIALPMRLTFPVVHFNLTFIEIPETFHGRHIDTTIRHSPVAYVPREIFVRSSLPVQFFKGQFPVGICISYIIMGLIQCKFLLTLELYATGRP